MATVIYTLSRKKDKISGKQEIMMRFFHGKFNQRGKTNLFTTQERWNESTQRNVIPTIRVMSQEKLELVRELKQQNKELEEISSFIQNAFVQDGGGKLPLPEKWLATKLLERLKATLPNAQLEESGESITESPIETTEKPSTISILEHFISVHHISSAQQRQYKVLLRALQRFALYTDTSIELDDLSAETLRDFEEFLTNEHLFIGVDKDGKPIIIDPKYQEVYDKVPECRYPKPRGKKYLIGMMSRYRTFTKWAKRNHYTSNSPFEEFEMGSQMYGTPFYLTKEERNQLYEATFPNNPGLDVIRDIFVFQCFIGCRVSDLRQLKKTSVINGAIEYIPRKTKEGRPITVRVPLSPTAQEILDRYKDLPGDKLLPFISDQDYNRDIKKMIRLAGIDRNVTIINSLTREEEQHPIWEVASSHMARRVLVGNLYKEVQDPNLIAKISGHVENSKAFNRYRKIDEEMAREVILKLE